MSTQHPNAAPFALPLRKGIVRYLASDAVGPVIEFISRATPEEREEQRDHVISAVNSFPLLEEMFGELNKAIAFLRSPRSFDADGLYSDWLKLKAKVLAAGNTGR
jgi:hypothetical protein